MPNFFIKFAVNYPSLLARLLMKESCRAISSHCSIKTYSLKRMRNN